jgi:hypothetical protein
MSATVAEILAIASGFILLGAHLSPASTIATSLIIDASLAPVAATVAYQHKRSVWRWAVAGLLFGAWALAMILVLVRLRREVGADDFPMRPDAA